MKDLIAGCRRHEILRLAQDDRDSNVQVRRNQTSAVYFRTANRGSRSPCHQCGGRSPQAVVWIVTRSESQVLRADGVRTGAELGRMTGMRRASGLDKPPVSLAAAPDELLQAWQAGRIALFGRKWGKEPSRSILGPSGLRLRDYRGEVCLGDRTLYFDKRPFWSNLSVRADDCKRCWAEPPMRTQPTSGPFVSAGRPPDGEVRAFIEEKRNALRAERKGAGRDVLLRAATNHFGLSRKVALDIWNNAPRDRKGGRPTKDKR